MERKMTAFKKILLLFFGMLVGAFVTYGVLGIINHNSFSFIVINSLAATGICTVFYTVGMFVIWIALKIVKIIPKKDQHFTFNKQ